MRASPVEPQAAPGPGESVRLQRSLRFTIFVGSVVILCLETLFAKLLKLDYYAWFQPFAVSLAMLGLGIGAALVARVESRADTRRLAHTMCLCSSLSIPWLIVRYPIDSLDLLWRNGLFVLVFVTLGALTAQIFLEIDSVRSGYFWNLAGAALGACAAPLSLALFGLQGAFLMCATLMLLAGLPWGLATGSRRRIVTAAAAVILAWLVPNWSQPSPPRGFSRNDHDKRASLTRWNEFSRIDVQRSETPVEWALGVNYQGPRTRGHFFTIDLREIYASNLSYSSIVTGLDQTESLTADITHLPIQGLPNGALVLVVGSGGGKDVLAARREGMDVVAVEFNPLIIEVMKERFPESYQAVYEDPGVRLVLEEVRTFLRRDARVYDVIQIATLKTHAALTSAASLEDNSIYTLDALQAYLEHLKEQGVLAVTWFAHDPWFFERLLKTWESLVGDLEGRVLAYQSGGDWPLQTLVLGRDPLPPSRIQAMTEWAHKTGFTRVEPQLRPESPGPVTDDRPFFYQYQRGLTKHMYWLIGVGLLAGLGVAGLNRRSPNSQASYFALIGTGYLGLQVFLLQRFSLFLGDPVYAYATGLASLLVANAIGCLWLSGTRRWSPTQAVIPILILTPIYSLGLDHLLQEGTNLPLWGRLILVFLTTLPLGVVTGVPFPSQLSRIPRTGIPHSFLANSLGGMIGTAAAVVLSVLLGYRLVALACMLPYAAAWFYGEEA